MTLSQSGVTESPPHAHRPASLPCSSEYVGADRGRWGATCSPLPRCLPSSGWLILKLNPRPLAQGALLTLCHIQIAPRSACKESLSENGSTVWWLAKAHSKAASAKAAGHRCACAAIRRAVNIPHGAEQLWLIGEITGRSDYRLTGGGRVTLA